MTQVEGAPACDGMEKGGCWSGGGTGGVGVGGVGGSGGGLHAVVMVVIVVISRPQFVVIMVVIIMVIMREEHAPMGIPHAPTMASPSSTPPCAPEDQHVFSEAAQHAEDDLARAEGLARCARLRRLSLLQGLTRRARRADPEQHEAHRIERERLQPVT